MSQQRGLIKRKNLEASKSPGTSLSSWLNFLARDGEGFENIRVLLHHLATSNRNGSNQVDSPSYILPFTKSVLTKPVYQFDSNANWVRSIWRKNVLDHVEKAVTALAEGKRHGTLGLDYWKQIEKLRKKSPVKASGPPSSPLRIEPLLFRSAVDYKDAAGELFRREDFDFPTRNFDSAHRFLETLNLFGGAKLGENLSSTFKDHIHPRDLNIALAESAHLLVEHGRPYLALELGGDRVPEVLRNIAYSAAHAFFRRANQGDHPVSERIMERAGALIVDSVDRLPLKEREKELDAHIDQVRSHLRKSLRSSTDKERSVIFYNQMVYALLKGAAFVRERRVRTPLDIHPAIVRYQEPAPSAKKNPIRAQNTQALAALIRTSLNNNILTLTRANTIATLSFLQRRDLPLYEELVSKIESGFFTQASAQQYQASDMISAERSIEMFYGLIDHAVSNRNEALLSRLARVPTHLLTAERLQSEGGSGGLENWRNELFQRLSSEGREIHLALLADKGFARVARQLKEAIFTENPSLSSSHLAGSWINAYLNRLAQSAGQNSNSVRKLFAEVESLVRREKSFEPSSQGKSTQSDKLLKEFIKDRDTKGLFLLAHMAVAAIAKGEARERVMEDISFRILEFNDPRLKKLHEKEKNKTNKDWAELGVKALYAGYLVGLDPVEAAQFEMRWQESPLSRSN
jgi:hypothetical protein